MLVLDIIDPRILSLPICGSAILERYQEAPHLLDPHLESITNPLIKVARDLGAPPARQTAVFSIIYLLTKVRGYKTVLKLFSHDAADFHPVLHRLLDGAPLSLNEANASLSPNEASTDAWKTCYILLLWMSLICMLPFNMKVLDSGGAESDVQKILRLCKVYLRVTDKAREGAAVLVSRLITRPDMQDRMLPDFLEWCDEQLAETDPGNVAGMTKLIGVLSALSAVFKLGKREDLLHYAAPLLKRLEASKFATCGNTLLRKLTAKLVQRVGLTFLVPKLAPWRYQRGNRFLMGTVSTGKTTEHIMATSQGDVQNDSACSSRGTDDDDDTEYDIPEEIEEVLELLLVAMKDKDTVVRWSAAKGVGRVTGRLPLELADDVVGSVLELCDHSQGDGAWHGACLTLAELGRRGLLLPQRLDEVVPVILRALAYDEMRGACSVGAHVRDAACYVAWAFARAYEPSVIKTYIESIARALLVVTVFDREINVRRAASAAFQENVGRQGTLPHGIDIITEADYFAVGNRTKSFLEISVYIAQFPEYTNALTSHLCGTKAGHWDRVIRDLTAKALCELATRCPEFLREQLHDRLIPNSVSIDLNLRHGSILSVGETVLGLSKYLHSNGKQSLEHFLGATVISSISNLVPELVRLEAFRGVGGEMIRQATCKMIKNLADAKTPFIGSATITTWQHIIDDNLAYEENSVQNAAIEAFGSLAKTYYVPLDDEARAVIEEDVIAGGLIRLLQENTSTPRVKRGVVLALGSLPSKLLTRLYQIICDSLVDAAQLPAEKSEALTETRRAAIHALVRVYQIAPPPVRKSDTERIMNTLFDSTKDYTIDNRGDIGSIVREEAMLALEQMTLLLSNQDNGVLWSEYWSSRVFRILIQQSLEKIDRTRSCAGEIMVRLLRSDSPKVEYVPCRSMLLDALGHDMDVIDWLAPSDTFPRMIQMLSIDTYRLPGILGIVVSVGGLTESLVRHSAASLLDFVAGLDVTGLVEILDGFLKVFAEYARNDRVIMPLLKSIDLLFSNGCFDELLEDYNGPGVVLLNQLMDLTKAEINKCGDIKLLSCATDVLCCLLRAGPDVQRRGLGSLLLLLAHRWPRVRRFTAEKMYLALLAAEKAVSEEVISEVEEILTNTLWDDKIETAREQRNRISDLVGIPRPKIKLSAKKELPVKVLDDLDSYRDLVDREG